MSSQVEVPMTGFPLYKKKKKTKNQPQNVEIVKSVVLECLPEPTHIIRNVYAKFQVSMPNSLGCAMTGEWGLKKYI